MPLPLPSLFILTAGLLQAPADSASAIGPGISEALARARAASITDVRYDLALDLTSPDSALGLVAIGFRRSGHGNVVLDFRGRRLGEVTVNGSGLDRPSLRDG
ncbi:MAG TPA: hypothetical protein VM387_02835, partial [Gemmatimonadales bacterium]|nr:hypothetical protein [Gemmatimonadales bacterium]